MENEHACPAGEREREKKMAGAYHIHSVNTFSCTFPALCAVAVAARSARRAGVIIAAG
jgi:hypothetical protein|eukprot:COSAG06_NODE_811_length_12162_cov_78.059935_1_plen_58_part_00